MAKTRSSKRKKRSPKKRSSSSGGAVAAAMNENKRDQDDEILEEAMELAAAEFRASIGAITLLNNDILGSVSSFLMCDDLFRLSLTCKQMTAAIEAVALDLVGAANVRYGGDDNKLSALEQMNLLLQSPLEFTDLLGDNIGYLCGDMACVSSSNPNRLHTPRFIDAMNMQYGGDWDGWDGENCTAICTNHVMTSGRHYAKFTVTSRDLLGESDWRYFYCRLGIMRPIGADFRKVPWSSWCPMNDQLLFRSRADESFADYLKNAYATAWGEGDVHCCLYYDFLGTCEWTNWNSEVNGVHTGLDWDGMLGCTFLRDTREYGLLLDLDEGTLSMYVDDEFVGVMMHGLTGEYCWVASILAQAHGRPEQQNVRIERAPVPLEVERDLSADLVRA